MAEPVFKQGLSAHVLFTAFPWLSKGSNKLLFIVCTQLYVKPHQNQSGLFPCVSTVGL